jgi:hypothetical protein
MSRRKQNEAIVLGSSAVMMVLLLLVCSTVEPRTASRVSAVQAETEGPAPIRTELAAASGSIHQTNVVSEVAPAAGRSVDASAAPVASLPRQVWRDQAAAEGTARPKTGAVIRTEPVAAAGRPGADLPGAKRPPAAMASLPRQASFTEAELQAANPNDRDPHMTGLPRLTPADLAWRKQHLTKVGQVRLNQLGLERVNVARKANGLPALAGAEARAMPIGSEIVPASGPGLGALPGEGLLPAEGGAGGTPPGLPEGVDNSTLKYFPPIRSQGGLNCCGVFSGTYYTMTYMYAMAHDLDAKNGSDAYRFSPKWTYNMVNGGANVGTWYYWAYTIGQEQGCATWQQFPYVGSTSPATNYTEWCLTPATWRSALNQRFDQKGYVDATDTDAGIAQVKALLANGYLVNYATFIGSWNWKTISDDPGTASDDGFVGKNCVYFVNGTNGYHAMTVVGYNDSIWVDINGDGVVDAGEKGAFRIANSWGPLWNGTEGGFAWIAYDALRSVSAVPGGPATNRWPCWYPPMADWVTARVNYRPKVIAEFTINHALRNQMSMSLGLSDTGGTVPATTWLPEYTFQYAGGALAFNGTATPTAGTFFMDFTGILPPAGVAKRWYLGMQDSAAGSAGTINAFKLYRVITEGDRLVGTAANVPASADASQAYAWVDYAFSADDSNVAPMISSFAPASPFGMSEGQTQVFSVQAWDADGDALTYAWTLDGAPIGGAALNSYSYTPASGTAGTHLLAVTVTDIFGASAVQTWTISVGKVVTVRAVDQNGAEVAGALIYVASKNSWYATGTQVQVNVGTVLSLRGNLRNVTGPVVSKTVALGDSLVTVPFWKTTVCARDQFGAEVAGAKVILSAVTGSPFLTGTSVTLPKGASPTAGGWALGKTGPTCVKVFTDGLDELTLPCWKTTLRARDQSGADVAGAKVVLTGVTGSPFTPNVTVTVPKGVSVLTSGWALNQTGPASTQVFSDGLDELAVPFWKVPLAARDQFGADVAGAKVQMANVTGTPFLPGTAVTLPKGLSVSVCGLALAKSGPASIQVFTDGLNELAVPFWKTTLRARDQSNAEVAGAKVDLSAVTGSPFPTGTAITLPKGLSVPAGGWALNISGSSTNKVFTAGLDELAVPFWKTTLLARDQSGADVAGATVNVTGVLGSPFAAGTVLTLPKGVTVTVSGSARGKTGAGSGRIFTDGLVEVAMPFWKATIVCRDAGNVPIPNAALVLTGVTGSPLPDGAVVSLPRGVVVPVRSRLLNLEASTFDNVTFNTGAETIPAKFRTVTLRAVASDGVTVVPGAMIELYGSGLPQLANGATQNLPYVDAVRVRVFKSGVLIADVASAVVGATTSAITVKTTWSP